MKHVKLQKTVPIVTVLILENSTERTCRLVKYILIVWPYLMHRIQQPNNHQLKSLILKLKVKKHSQTRVHRTCIVEYQQHSL